MKNIIALILCGVLFSCSSAQSINSAVVTAEQLAYYYDGNITELLSSVELSQTELATIDNSLRVASRIRASFERYKADPTQIPANLTILEIEYQRLKNAYLAVREIAVANEAEYDIDTWYTFQVFDAFASRLDQDFAELVDSAELNENITNAIYLANSIIRIAALL